MPSRPRGTAARLADRRSGKRCSSPSGCTPQDQRQREPYLNHLLRVALRIICHYDVCDTDIICAALLHDAVEAHADDLAANGRPGAFAALAASFGPQVASLVEAVRPSGWRMNIGTDINSGPSGPPTAGPGPTLDRLPVIMSDPGERFPSAQPARGAF